MLFFDGTNFDLVAKKIREFSSQLQQDSVSRTLFQYFFKKISSYYLSILRIVNSFFFLKKIFFYYSFVVIVVSFGFAINCCVKQHIYTADNAVARDC